MRICVPLCPSMAASQSPIQQRTTWPFMLDMISLWMYTYWPMQEMCMKLKKIADGCPPTRIKTFEKPGHIAARLINNVYSKNFVHNWYHVTTQVGLRCSMCVAINWNEWKALGCYQFAINYLQYFSFSWNISDENMFDDLIIYKYHLFTGWHCRLSPRGNIVDQGGAENVIFILLYRAK